MTDQLIADIKLGQCLHGAIKKYVSMETDYEGMHETFLYRWGKYKEWNLLKYQDGENWDTFASVGSILLMGFKKSYEAEGLVPILSENGITYFGNKRITKRPDLVANKCGGVVIIDFKFGKSWTQEEVDMNEQLTEYAMIVSQALMEEPPVRVAICNLRKHTRDVNWIYSLRTREQIEAFIIKNDKEMSIEDVLGTGLTPF